MRNSVVLPAPLGPITPTMPPGGSLKREIVDQQPVAEALRQMLEVDDVVAEPLGDGNDDLRGARRLARSAWRRAPRSARCAPCSWPAAPSARRRSTPPPRRWRAAREASSLLLLLEALLLLLEPGGVVALVGNAAAAIELEDPARHVVEEVAVVGDDQDRAGIVAQMAFEPVDRLGVEMVGRLVEQQQLRLFEQQPAERDAAALAAGELGHVGVVGRAAERVHRLLDLAVEIPQALGLDLVLQPRHLVGGLVGIVHRQLVVAVERSLLGLDAEHRRCRARRARGRAAAPAADSRRARPRRRSLRRRIPCRCRP